MIHFTKKDLPEGRGDEAPIYVGSRVMIVDGSYTVLLDPKKGIIEVSLVGLSNDIWTVIAINVVVPTEKASNSCLLPVFNNCIIINADEKIVFCSSLNIRNIRKIGEKDPKISNKIWIPEK